MVIGFIPRHSRKKKRWRARNEKTQKEGSNHPQTVRHVESRGSHGKKFGRPALKRPNRGNEITPIEPRFQLALDWEWTALGSCSMSIAGRPVKAAPCSVLGNYDLRLSDEGVEYLLAVVLSFCVML